MLRLLVTWDVLKSYVTDGLLLWRRHRAQRKACAFFSAEIERRIARANTPWAMLDREEAQRVATAWCQQHGINPEYAEIRPLRVFLDSEWAE